MAKSEQTIEFPDAHYVRAAEGWLELGDPGEAKAEIEQVSSVYCAHSEVLKVRWQIWARMKEWEAAFTVAQALIKVAPDLSVGWIYLAYTIRRLPAGGMEKAWNVLLPAARRFPKESIIAYNLAYYACKLGKLEEARTWLGKALKEDSAHKIQQMALAEPGLRPLWPQIKGTAEER